MKYALAAGLAVMLGLAGVTTGYGQTATQSTPTTKILTIGTINPGVEPEKVFAMLPEEVRDTANLYLDGKIDQWYSQQNGKGVVFILNVTDPAAAMKCSRSCRSARSLHFVGYRRSLKALAGDDYRTARSRRMEAV
jgi:hypothetical protein